MSLVDLGRIPAFYHRYIQRSMQDELPIAFEKHISQMVPFLKSLSADKWDYSYAPGKWTVKELVQHLIDAERIFAYRALCFARKDATPLPGFDENSYVVHSAANRRSAEDLMQEFLLVQQSSAALFASFDEEQLESTGSANGNPVYVRGIGYIIIGHALHHKAILEERYL